MANKPKLLFVDDSSARIHKALEIYSEKYDVTIAPNVKEALRLMSFKKWNVISLDHDLSGCDFDDPDLPTSGMEIVRYLAKFGWPHEYHPEIIIHSSNAFAARVMKERIEEIMPKSYVSIRPFGWKTYQVGVVAGAFDVIHVGYIWLLKFASDNCHKLIVLMHDKPDQCFDIETRKEIVLGLKGVDDVIVYKTEEELTRLLEEIKPDVRILGSDHEGVTSRPEYKTIYHERDHSWSATLYKSRIVEYIFSEKKGF